ncbi:MAG: PrsW family intramembrane metalloprotease [Pseudomonadota bacterium]
MAQTTHKGVTVLPDTLSYGSLLTLPLLFWAAYHYYHDRHRPEPLPFLLFAMLLGYLSAFLGIYFYETLDEFGLRRDAFALAEQSRLQLFLYAVLAIGPIEELAKFVPFLLLLIHSDHFDEAFDGVIYASFVAMGFSLHENQHYLLMLEGPAAVGRAIASPMVHILFASIWGYGYGYADRHGRNRAIFTTLALLLAMVLHGIYDYFALAMSVWTHVVPPLLIGTIWMTRTWLTRPEPPVT